MIEIKHFEFNDFHENTYVVWDETLQCMIVDPGCYTEKEKNELKNFILGKQLNPVLLVNTHCHIDHILGNNFVSEQWNLALHLHKEELKTYEETGRWADFFGIVTKEMPKELVFIDDTQKLNFGNSSFDILFTPGHSIASLSFYNPNQNFILAGDVLFSRSIGRTDLPGGNHQQLLDVIRTKLFTLPDDCIVYSGHGPATNIGDEKKFNPFLN